MHFIDPLSVKRLRKDTADLSSVEGCVEGPTVLRDLLSSEMSNKDWRMTVEYKRLGSRNLATELPKDIDYTAILSSASNVIGLTDQSNYAAGVRIHGCNILRYQIAHCQAVSLNPRSMVTDGVLVKTTRFLKKLPPHASHSPAVRLSSRSLLRI